MSLGNKIYSLRTEKNMSQEDFAEILEVSRQSVSKWETDASVPELDKLIKICNIFNISLDELTGRTSDAPMNVSEEETDNSEPDFDIEIYSSSQEEAESTENKKSCINNISSSNKETTTTHKKKSKKKQITALFCALCLLTTAIIVPFNIDKIKNLWWELNGGKIQYTNVLVHGLGGWGNTSPMCDVANYWGGGSDDLVDYLNGQEFTTIAPSVGPISSCWDRACELYAQLTGTTVDYGKAHSETHGHERYGRTYETPLVENWGKRINGGQLVKVNFVGHSFGGNTVRLLASLLEYGSEEEKGATGKDTSPLFTGKKGNWINCIVTLCSPHNGSSLTEILDRLGNIANISSLTDLLISLMFAFADNGAVYTKYDLQLEHFGIGITNNDQSSLEEAIKTVISSSNDHAGYDLTPDGAAELNKKIKIVDSIYYFSYSYSTTTPSIIPDVQMPSFKTLPLLYPLALSMGSFSGTTAGGIAMKNDWRENDGLVNVISAKYPFTEEYQDYNSSNISRGIWNVMPTREGDHGKVIGLNSTQETTHLFWTELLNMLKELR